MTEAARTHIGCFRVDGGKNKPSNNDCCKYQINIPSLSLTQFELCVIVGLFVAVITLREWHLGGWGGVRATCISEHRQSGNTAFIIIYTPVPAGALSTYGFEASHLEASPLVVMETTAELALASCTLTPETMASENKYSTFKKKERVQQVELRFLLCCKTPRRECEALLTTEDGRFCKRCACT